jgi:hypothetical protein
MTGGMQFGTDACRQIVRCLSQAVHPRSSSALHVKIDVQESAASCKESVCL